MVDLSAKPMKIKAYALVRDKHGRPKVDDPSTLPPEIINALSKEDLEYIYGPHSHNSSPKHAG